MSSPDTPDRDTGSASCCGPTKPLTAPSSQDQACCSDKPTGIEIGLDMLVAPAGEATATACCDTPKPGQGLAAFIGRLWSAWSLIALIPLLVLVLDGERLPEVLGIASSALGTTAPFILVAVLLIAYLKAAGAEGVIGQVFQGRENRMIILAALVGGLAPFCSCQVIPFVAGLLAVGVPVSAVMAFWLSSPLIDPPSLLVTAGALGWEFAIGKAMAAVFLGLFGGFGVKWLLQRNQAFASPLKNTPVSSCSSGSCDSSEAIEQPVWLFWQQAPRIAAFRSALTENLVFLFKWLTLAYLLEALLILYVPASLIGGLVGGEGFWPIVLGALVGMPAYLNSFAAPPLVAGLVEQGMSVGSAMAFMVAGAISSIPAMTAVWSLVKRPVFAAYLGFGLSGAILFGVAFAALSPLV